MYREHLIFSTSLDDKCQFWLKENSRILISPYFDGVNQRYYLNLNYTWMLKTEQGFYINFEIEGFWVKNNRYIKIQNGEPETLKIYLEN